MCGVVSTLILNYFREGILTTDDTDGRGWTRMDADISGAWGGVGGSGAVNFVDGKSDRFVAQLELHGGVAVGADLAGPPIEAVRTDCIARADGERVAGVAKDRNDDSDENQCAEAREKPIHARAVIHPGREVKRRISASLDNGQARWAPRAALAARKTFL